MPRKRVDDFLQDYPFYLADVSVSARPPFFVLGSVLSLGFNTCSSPEITLETEEIAQYHSSYKVPYYTKAAVSPITLTRGTSAFDSTMYRWAKRSMSGQDRVHRHLMLIHFMSLSYTAPTSADPSPSSAFDVTSVGMIRPMGKAFLLWHCIPTRYKAGTDFDATSGNVSITELEIQPQYFSEVSLDPGQIFNANVG